MTHRGAGSIYRQAASRIWWLSYYRNGKRVRESSGTTSQHDARRVLNLRLGEVATGLGTRTDAQRAKVTALLGLVRRDYEAKGRRSIRRVILGWAHIDQAFGGLSVADLDFDRLDQYLASRTLVAAPTTAAYELRMLKRALKLAVRAGWITKAHVPEFPSLGADRVRVGFFEDADVTALVAVLPAYLRGVVRFASITGWRVPSEVLTLRWSAVDFTAGIVRLEPGTTKNGDGREFPFGAHPALASVLLEQKRVRDQLARDRHVITPWVFTRDGAPIKDYRWAWKAALKAAGLPADRIPHDLRRSAVRNLVRVGVPQTVAMLLTGHRTASVFSRYNITSPKDLTAAVAQLAAQSAG